MTIKLFKLNLVPFGDGPGNMGEFNDDLSGNEDVQDVDVDDSADDVDDDSNDSDDVDTDDDQDVDDDKDDDKSDDDKVDDDKEEDKEEDDDDKDKDKDKEEDEEKEDKSKEKVSGRPTIRAIKEKFPEIFKTFPELKGAIFREREFSKVFGSIEDAQEAAGKADALDGFTEAIENGEINKLVIGIGQEHGRAAAEKFCEDFLPSLYELDEKLYLKITQPVIKSAIRAVFNHGKRSGQKDYMTAAKYISNYLFDSPEVESTTRVEPRNREQDNRESEFLQTQLRAAGEEVSNRIYDRIKKYTLEAIDPDNQESEIVRDALADKVMKEVNKIIVSDRSYQVQSKSLWKKAKQSGYVGDSLQRIINAYVGRARQSMPSILRKIRVDSDKSDDKGKRKVKKDLPTDKSKGSSQKVVKTRDIDYGKTSDRDLLDGRVTLKSGKTLTNVTVEA